MYERAREAATILVRNIRGELHPTMALECPPLLTPLQTQVTTRDTPMKRIIDLVHRLEEDPRVISIAAFGGFPFADIEPTGFSCVVVTNNAPALAARLAKQITDTAVAEGDNWIVHPTPPEEAVRRAMAAPHGPVILADIADSGAGGTAGDATAHEEVSDVQVTHDDQLPSSGGPAVLPSIVSSDNRWGSVTFLHVAAVVAFGANLPGP